MERKGRNMSGHIFPRQKEMKNRYSLCLVTNLNSDSRRRATGLRPRSGRHLTTEVVGRRIELIVRTPLGQNQFKNVFGPGWTLSRVGRRNEVGGRSGWTCCKMTKDDSSAAEQFSSGHPRAKVK